MNLYHLPFVGLIQFMGTHICQSQVILKSLDELITYPKQNRKRKCNDTYGKDNRLKK
jgi:hypothetical protein